MKLFAVPSGEPSGSVELQLMQLETPMFLNDRSQPVTKPPGRRI